MIEAGLPLLQRWLAYLGVLALTGVATWLVWVRRRAVSRPGPGPGHDAVRPAIEALTGPVERIGLGAALLLLPAWGLSLAVQVAAFRDPFVPLREDVAFLVWESSWGAAWLVQGSLAAALALCFLRLARERRRRALRPDQGRASPARSTTPRLAVGLILLLPVTQALTSHAVAESGIHRVLAVGSDALHGLAAGAWIGSLGVILLAGYQSPDRRQVLAAQFRAFSPIALLAVPLLVGMGVVLATYHLSAFRDLWEAPYGRMLAAKVLVAGAVLWLGFRNWRRGLPQMASAPAGVEAVRRRAAWEVGVAVLVLGLTAALTGLTVP